MKGENDETVYDENEKNRDITFDVERERKRILKTK